MKNVENKTLYHINSKSSVNPYQLLEVGDVVDTSKNYNPFRLSYEIGFKSFEHAESSAKTYWRFTKELAIEQTRMQVDPTLPSRWRCLWLTDEEHLDYWKNCLKEHPYKIFKVKLYGKLFFGDAHWVELPPSPLRKVRDYAKHYWNGDIFRPGKLEYLFEGQAEIVSLI